MTQVSDYYNRIAKDYHKQYGKDVDEYPANKIRLAIIIDRLKKLGVKSVYEIGVGEGTPLATIAKETGAKVAGCDFSFEMVSLAQEKLSPETIIYANAENDMLYLGGGYDAVIATGVLPHMKRDEKLLLNIHKMLITGGTVFVEFRNSIFSLFSFNRHTREFIINELLASSELRDLVKLWEPIAMLGEGDNLPERQFDKISKFHNPFELQKTFEANGFDVRGFHWYHYHAAPPIFEHNDFQRERFREELMKMEGSGDWRGMFLCSAGVIEAVKK